MSFDQLVTRALRGEFALLQPPLQLLHGKKVVHHLPHRLPSLGQRAATHMWDRLFRSHQIFLPDRMKCVVVVGGGGGLQL